jgi:hypothetical protein
MKAKVISLHIFKTQVMMGNSKKAALEAATFKEEHEQLALKYHKPIDKKHAKLELVKNIKKVA